MLGYYLMPHPPIIINEIGQGRENEAINTLNACKDIGKKIDTLEPETIIIVSPHGTVFRDAIAIVTSSNLKGDFGKFDAPHVKLDFQIDKELTNEIIKNATKEAIPTASLDENTSNLYNIDLELDHGAMVPLYFVDNTKNYKLVHITYGMLSPLKLMNFGKCINKAINNTDKKAVFIASGDLSHRLTKDGPYPYTPLGAEFDNKLIDTLEKGDFKGLFTLDKNLICEAGECGLRSLYILAGVLNDNNISSNSAALNDPRFSPLRKEELLDIDISVDLLYPPEPTTFEKLLK